jgi:uncharacterized protein DUF6285
VTPPAGEPPAGEPPEGEESTGRLRSGPDLHGRPTAGELVDAVLVFLRDQLPERRPDSSDAGRRHQIRIAVHALEIVGRELALGPAQREEHERRLRAIGYEDDRALADDIRSGRRADSPELRRVLREDTKARLLVANPGWLPAEG